ncbi:MAG: hypothetical protein WBN08_17525 [Thiogranum sp.]
MPDSCQQGVWILSTLWIIGDVFASAALFKEMEFTPIITRSLIELYYSEK